MTDCLNCDKYNVLAEENENILDKYNLLKLEYDRHDNICLDYEMIGFIVGVVVTLLSVILI